MQNTQSLCVGQVRISIFKFNLKDIFFQFYFRENVSHIVITVLLLLISVTQLKIIFLCLSQEFVVSS